MSNKFNRMTGLMVVNVVNSNPNGDPDGESDPRTFDMDQRGIISPVSVKRKIRDIVGDSKNDIMDSIFNSLNIDVDDRSKYQIFSRRKSTVDERANIPKEDRENICWDVRTFGCTNLEKEGESFIRTGVIQFGLGVSINPIEITRLTTTVSFGVEKNSDKDRGMSPLGYRVVRHGLYIIPFFVNAMYRDKTGCTVTDIEIFKRVVPYTFKCNISASRTQVDLIHAWFIEHKTPMGSCPDYMIVDALTPTSKIGDTPSTSIFDYNIPDELPENIKDRIKSCREVISGNDWIGV